MFGQFIVPEPVPGLGEVDGGAVVDGDALVDGDGEALVSGTTLGDGDVAACATTKVPNPPARPTPKNITIFAIGPRIHPWLLINLITSLAVMGWLITATSEDGEARLSKG